MQNFPTVGRRECRSVPKSGPYNNSFPNKRVPSRTAWLNTYWDK